MLGHGTVSIHAENIMPVSYTHLDVYKRQQQGCEEIKKLTRFMRDIWPVDVYGGAAMDRQIMRLRRANLVIGTPGRIMDHMRRGTLSLEHIRLVEMCIRDSIT